jgi:hypothetical protein
MGNVSDLIGIRGAIEAPARGDLLTQHQLEFLVDQARLAGIKDSAPAAVDS